MKNWNNNNEIEKQYCLSDIQKGLVFHSLSDIQQGMYNAQVCFTLKEDVDVDFLQKAWNLVIKRHEILRASISGNYADAKLLIHRFITFPIIFKDVSHYESESKAAELERLLKKDRNISFDFSKAPIMRIMLIKLANNYYKLVWTHHHVLLAGTSAADVAIEAFNLYDSFCNKKQLELATPRSYQDYIDYLDKFNLREGKEYWQSLLSGFTTPTKLLINQQDIISTYSQQRISMHLSKAQTKELKKFAHSNNLTLNIIIQTVWGLLLTKYSGEDDVVFGATRALPANVTTNLIGMFMNTLPIRIRIGAEASVLDCLQTIRRQHKELRNFVNTPLNIIKQWSEISASLPLFETIVDFKPISSYAYLSSKSNTWKNKEVIFTTQTNYPLLLEAYIEDDKLHFNINHTIYELNTILQMINHLKNLLINIMKYPELSVVKLPILSKKQLQTILYKWNDTQKDYPEDKTIHQLFEEQVKRTPNNTAIVFENRNLTYLELNKKANQLAHYLNKLGVKPDHLVAICIERSIEMIVSILGILKAGGAYVSIDPTYPGLRITYILNDINARILLTQKDIKGKLLIDLDKKRKIIILNNALKAELEKASIDNLPCITNPDNLAYVIYTSGSTGVPKGVMIEHKGIVNLAFSEINSFNITDKTRVLNYAPFIFDAAVWELYSTLLTGAAFFITRNEYILPGSALFSTLLENKITLITLPPSTLNMLPVKKVNSLKTIIVAGESCPLELIKKWSSLVSLINAYGPTENTVCTTMKFCSANDKKVTIGKPISNVKVYILDKHMQPVPINVMGELYISGVGLARGYLNQPDLTNEKFISDPFNKGNKLYKTGDLARWLSSGELEYIGRIDDQVKIRGFRIELDEINTHILKYPGILQSIVLAKDDDKKNKYLVAYISCDNKKTFIIREIKKHLEQILPHYIIPEQFFLLDNLPITANGKIDKKALLNYRVNISEEVPVDNVDLQNAISKVFKELLECDNINVNRNFFELGIHSFMVMQACHLLNNKFGVNLKPVDLFTYPTIRSLANFINQSVKESSLFDLARAKIAMKKQKLSKKRKFRHGCEK